MKFNNINKCLITLSILSLIDPNNSFSMEDQSGMDDSIIQFGSHDSNNKKEYETISQKPDATIKIEDIKIEETSIGQVNVRNNTNKIPYRKPVLNNNTSYDNKVNNNKIVVKNHNLVTDPTVSQIFQYSINQFDRVRKRIIVQKKSKKTNNKNIKQINKQKYNENNLKADITDLENAIFYESNDYKYNNEYVHNNYYINCDEVIQNWNAGYSINKENLSNEAIQSNVLNNYMKFIYNNLETNLNNKIENIIYIINNHNNTNNFSYYKY